MTGSAIGHYQILEKLGEGGMGVVYKARDTSLDRFVAIKLIHAEKLGDPDRVLRFTQEARTASALNHPNIITIHEISTHDGAPFIVMEFVPGKPLDRLIPRKGMRPGEILKIGSQIAAALAAAAAAGIIHRDVKPGNVMVTDTGHVKVLDFGLAKLQEQAATPEEATRTIAAPEDAQQPHTREGAVVGTASYMSPEQAEGKILDPRSDIFSFGAVLYEMSTGQRAFRGDTVMSTISLILRDEPKPPSQLAADIPRDLDKIIVRCLRKDPERRFQHMADVRVTLLELKEESESGQLPASAPPQRNRAWMWISAATVAVLLATGLWVMKRNAAPLPPQTVVPVTTYPGMELEPSFSPDGKQVAFRWDGERGVNPGIYIKLLGETNALRLTTGPDYNPAWAPDGKRIAFMRPGAGHGIYTVSALGGAERKLSSVVSYSQMSWSPDGKWLSLASANPQDSAILLLPLEGGEPRRMTNPLPPAADRAPAFSPDGRRLAYADCASEASCDIYVQELGPDDSPQGSPHRITRQGVEISYGTAWSRDGRSVIYSASHAGGGVFYLWRTGVDDRQAPQRLEVAGPYAFSPSVSSSANRLVFARLLDDYDIWRYRLNEGMQPFIVSSLLEDAPQYSPDGTQITFSSDRTGDAFEVWVAQADGSKPVQMTNRLGRHQGSPRWSPDGRWIAFDSLDQDGHRDLYVMESSGGSPRKITSEPGDKAIPSWSRDGKWIYFRSDRTGKYEIWRVPFAGGPAQQVTTHGGNAGYESVDGKTLFYDKWGATGPLYARSLSGGEERQAVPYVSVRAFEPVADGIYYIGRRSDEGAYPLEFLQFSSNTSRLLSKIEGPLYLGLGVSPDRKTILFSKSGKSGANLMMIENFR